VQVSEPIPLPGHDGEVRPRHLHFNCRWPSGSKFPRFFRTTLHRWSTPHELRERLQAALGSTYTLERELSGGMSRVFVATEASLSRRVVVKVLPPERTYG
jgi:hypothetical protein